MWAESSVLGMLGGQTKVHDRDEIHSLHTLGPYGIIESLLEALSFALRQMLFYLIQVAIFRLPLF